MDTNGGEMSAIEHDVPIPRDIKNLPSSSVSAVHAAPEVIGSGDEAEGESAGENADEIQASKGGWFAYFKTRNFYLVLLLGYDNIELPVWPKGAVSYAELCATQTDPIPLYHSH